MATDKKISELPVAAIIDGVDHSVLVKNGVDYQFAFNTLLQFMGTELSVGANIMFGNSMPSNTTGKNGDVFINTATGSFAQKITGIWTVAYALPAGNTGDGTILYGNNNPGVAIGKNNDTYINVVSGVFYKKSSDTWSQVFSMQTGPAGAQGPAGANGPAGINGKTILSGNGNPSNLYTGTDGDYYIDTNGYFFFGPKTNGIWPAGFSLDNQVPDPIILSFPAGSPNPIVIENFQVNYAQDFGNQPSLIIMEKISDDGLGNPAVSDRNDIRALRYYSDWPANTILSSISIETGDGAILSNDYIIKLTL